MAQPNFNVQVTAVRQLTERVREYLLSSLDGSALPSYTAGAHIALHTHSAERGLIVRHYSLLGGCSGQDDARHSYRIAVQREDHARGSAHIHATFQPGTRLQIGPPQNNFPLDRRDRQVLLIAGGIGITPIFSMTRSLARRHCDYRVFYAGRQAAVMAYHTELQQLAGERAHFHYSDSQGQPDLLALLAAQPEGTQVYACGPQPMIDAVYLAAAALGWSPERVRSERFTPPVPADAQTCSVHLQRRGQTIEVGRDVSILDALLAQGVPVLWDCRRGECGLCPQAVLHADGGIEHHDHYLSPEEKASGQTLCLCVSRPRGQTLVLDL